MYFIKVNGEEPGLLKIYDQVYMTRYLREGRTSALRCSKYYTRGTVHHVYNLSCTESVLGIFTDDWCHIDGILGLFTDDWWHIDGILGKLTYYFEVCMTGAT